MKYLHHIVPQGAVLLLLLSALCLSACGDRVMKGFDRLLVQLADTDETIDGADWQVLTDYIRHNKQDMQTFYEDGQISSAAVLRYARDFFANRRPAHGVRMTGVDGGAPLNFHIYLENSGSMTAYDSKDGDGRFAATVMALQNALPGSTKVSTVGERGYTDFRALFTQLLQSNKAGEVSMLVTDMIYSVRDMRGVNPRKVFAEMQQMVNAVFKQQVKHKTMLIVRLNASYNGPYYAYDNSVHPYNGTRPYYVIMVGDNDVMQRMAMDPDLRTLTRISAWSGYEGRMLFTAEPLPQPAYTLLLSHADIRGRFRPVRGQATAITHLEDVEGDVESGGLRIVMAVNLSGTLLDEGYLTDKNNYAVESASGFAIEQIRPIRRSDITGAERRYAADCTHVMVLSCKQPTGADEVHIKLLNKLPDWAVNGSTDNDLTPDAHTTFGLKYLMQGIYDSYARNTAGKPYYIDMQLNIDR